MDHRIPLRLLYALLFVCFAALGLTRDVANWLSTRFGSWVMIGSLVAYAAVIIGVISLINRINSNYYVIKEDVRTTEQMSETALILNYLRQERQTQLSTQFDPSTGPEAPKDPKAQA